MTLNEFCEYLKNPLAEAKARVVISPPGESWTALRRFCLEHGGIELRLSDIVNENAWLPMPDEVFRRVSGIMTAQEASGKDVVLLGLPGYLALLTDENKRAAIVALREWVDGACGYEALCLLRSDDGTGLIVKDIFVNPRYRQGKQLIVIEDGNVLSPIASEETERISRRTEVMLVEDALASFVPEVCDTFQKYLRYIEEHPSDSSARRIVVASEGRELAGLSVEVRQVVCLRDFARVFYDVEDTGLSEDVLRWMCQQGKKGAGKTLPEILKTFFFQEDGITKRVLCVFNGHNGIEREALLWLIKHLAHKGSYLECVARQEGVLVSNFRSAYITGAAEWLDESVLYASERRDAIREADVRMSGADIRQFIVRCTGESTSRVAPWLNCGTDMERAELLRRCAVDGIASNAVKNVYPEVAAYLHLESFFNDVTLEDYFRKYRELKIAGRVTPEFYERAQLEVPPNFVQSRDAIVQRYTLDNGCALLVVDAMGAEWLPMLVMLALQRNMGVDSIAVGEANLPTTTQFNNIYWPDVARRLPDIKRFDNIVHNGVETHETRCAEENLAAALDVIGGEVLPRVAEGLIQFERVLVTADHGSSRLAVLAWQTKPRLARTLSCETGADVADWRYRERAAQGTCPPELEETLDGRHWVVRGYNRLPKKGGGQGFEIHGGATLDERLVPVVIFSRKGQFVPNEKTSGKRAQIVENDDFDL
ncbi:MAG: BREX-4 system phosphatase PglZ [Proteobacteria bacterium]|nr:BREX-4 system phosphatase PglZ [Pseudomonadota bacterium]MBU1057841.1 BREX-4 system phosphatase PglZ [Pseudomonadota bacterium]